MKDALEIINTNKIYKNIFKEIGDKYKIYERFTGSFTIKANSEEEIYVLSNFDSNVFYTNRAKIKVSNVVNLFESKLRENTFKELVEHVLREEITSNKQAKKLKIDEENEFYNNILKNYNSMLGATWIKKSIVQKQYGYTLLSKYYKQYRDSN
ncbi:MAG: TIGR02679 domain-containing protein, partial [Peptostreptococcaceae bacterium]